MAAVFAPSYHDREERPTAPARPQLRLVPPPSRRQPIRPIRPAGPTAAVYRRRRLAALLVLVTVVALAVLLLSAVWPSGHRAGPGASGGSPLTPAHAPAGVTAVSGSMQAASASVYVVRPGDTLWSIARAIHPSGDVRRVVDRLAAGRHGAPLQPGERIALP